MKLKYKSVQYIVCFGKRRACKSSINASLDSSVWIETNKLVVLPVWESFERSTWNSLWNIIWDMNEAYYEA